MCARKTTSYCTVILLKQSNSLYVAMWLVLAGFRQKRSCNQNTICYSSLDVLLCMPNCRAIRTQEDPDSLPVFFLQAAHLTPGLRSFGEMKCANNQEQGQECLHRSRLGVLSVDGSRPVQDVA